MKTIFNIFSTEFIEAIGWTLLHSLWQGTIIAIALTLLILLMRRNSAQLKYVISFFALILMLGWSGLTFTTAYKYATEKTALKTSITADPGYIKTLLSHNIAETKTQEVQTTGIINMKIVKIRSAFQRNFTTISLLWIIGMFFFVVRIIGGLLYTRRLRSYQIVKIEEEWLNKISAFASKLGIRRKVEAFFSPLTNVPITIGAIKPIILFPISAFTGLSSRDIEAIIAHELAHVLRHDYFFNIIQSLVEILYFFHPAIWIISAQIRAERENSCDNIAIELTGDKVAYVKALASVQINQTKQEQLVMTFASRKSSILQRIKRLQKQVAMKTNFFEGLIAAGVIVIGLALVSFTMNKPNPQISHANYPTQDEETTQTSNKTYSPVTSLPATKTWTPEQVDSVRHAMEKNLENIKTQEDKSEEIEKIIEVALSENDEDLSAEMMEEINTALKDIDLEAIVHDALREAHNALKEIDMSKIVDEAQRDIDRDEIKRDMEEAQRDIEEARKEMREEMRREMKDGGEASEEIIRLSIEAAETGLDVASAVLENLDIGGIIDMALGSVESVFEAIDAIDIDSIETNDEFSEEDLDQLKKQLEQKQEEIKKAKEQIKEKEMEKK